MRPRVFTQTPLSTLSSDSAGSQAQLERQEMLPSTKAPGEPGCGAQNAYSSGAHFSDGAWRSLAGNITGACPSWLALPVEFPCHPYMNTQGSSNLESKTGGRKWPSSKVPREAGAHANAPELQVLSVKATSSREPPGTPQAGGSSRSLGVGQFGGRHGRCS